MKAFIVDRYGSKSGLPAGEMPDPELRDDDVLVQLQTAASTFWFPKSETESSNSFGLIAYPSFLGMMCWGRGPGRVRVRRFKPGDEFYARPDERRGRNHRAGRTQSQSTSKLPSGKAARRAAFARRFAPRSLFDKIRRSQFGWRNREVYLVVRKEGAVPPRPNVPPILGLPVRAGRWSKQ